MAARRVRKDESTPVTTAQLYAAQGKFEQAEKVLRQAAQTRPGDAMIAHALGVLLMQRERFEDACSWCEDAVAAQPQSPQYNTTLGMVLWQLGQHRRALDAWHTSLYLQPFQTEVLALLAAGYRMTGDTYSAIDYYKQASSSAPGNGELHYRLADCYNEAGLLEDACRCYALALQRWPFHLPLLRDSIENVLVLARYDECRVLLEQAQQYYPDAGGLWHLKGLLGFRTDQFDEALAAYEAALALHPEHRDLLLDYAVCLRTMGDDASAEKVLMKVRELSGG